MNQPFKFTINTFQDFCSNSSVHGVPYLTEKKQHWIERLWWFVVISASFGLCGWYIKNLWIEWNVRPTIITFDDKLLSISEIQFPAFTVCPYMTSNNFSDFFNRNDLLRASNEICPLDPEYVVDKSMFISDEIYDVFNHLIERDLPKYEKCFWNLQEWNCNYLIQSTLTSFGICDTFNSLNVRKIYTDEISTKLVNAMENSDFIVDPFRGINSERLFKVNSVGTFRFNHGKERSDVDDYGFCLADANLFKISFHAPNEIPQMLNDYSNLVLGNSIKLQIEPTVIKSSENLRHYDVKYRQCYFEDERHLRFFRSYTENNCKTECLANYTKVECGCVKFFMPRDKRTKICGYGSRNCVSQVLLQSGVVDLSTQSTKFKNFNAECDCLPRCNLVDYYTDIDQAVISDANFLKVQIFFKNNQFFPLIRLERFTWTEFIAKCGGLFGVFVGASLLSFIEPIYWICSIYSKLNQNRNRELDNENSVKKAIGDFCCNSTIHGVQYLTDKKLRWIGKLWWIITISLSFLACGWLIKNLWDKWTEHPTKYDFNDEPLSLTKIRFPAVTVCSTNTQRRSHALENGLTHTRLFNMTVAEDKRTFYDDKYYEALNIMHLEINKVITNCIWTGARGNCDEFFVPVVTDNGICHTFNSWNQRDIYTDVVAPVLVKATKDNVERNGTRLVFQHTPISVFSFLFPDFFIGEGIESNHIVIHAPNEIPQILTDKSYIQFGNGMDIFIEPTIVYTSNDLRQSHYKYRKCYFEDERILRFFRSYTESNCKVECLSNYTKSGCGCVKFFMPRDNATKVCGVRKRFCAENAKQNFAERNDVCDCLPLCNLVRYNVDISTTGEQSDMGSPQNITILFKNQEFIPLLKSARYNWVGFFSDCGGLFGLFMGASLLSFIELIYFWAIELPYKKWQQNRDHNTCQQVHNTEKSHSFAGIVQDFCSKSTVHGLRFLAEKYHWIWKLWWYIAIGVSFFLCGSSVRDHWLDWNEKSTFFDFNDKPIPIGELTFPAVTVCSSDKARKLKWAPWNQYNDSQRFVDSMIKFQAVNFTDGEWYPTNFIRLNSTHAYRFSPVICDWENLKHFTDEDIFSNDTVVQAFNMLSDVINSAITNCSWISEKTECKQIFQPTLNADGFCYTFNSLSAREIYTNEVASDLLTALQNDNIKKSDSLRRISKSGPKASFHFTYIEQLHYLDKYCENKETFKISIHSPNEIPQMLNELDYTKLQFEKDDIMLAIEPSMTDTSSNLLNYDLKHRKCYIENERKLQFFRSYTESNCKMECLSDYAIAECGCVKFFMPRNDSAKMCGEDTNYCIDQAVQSFRYKETNCDCLPLCNSMKYRLDFSRQNHEVYQFMKREKIYHSSNISVFFKKNQFMPLRRLERSTWAEFFATCGGFFNLYMGASLVSFAELIYFSITNLLRLTTNLVNENAATIHEVNDEVDEVIHESSKVLNKSSCIIEEFELSDFLCYLEWTEKE